MREALLRDGFAVVRAFVERDFVALLRVAASHLRPQPEGPGLLPTVILPCREEPWRTLITLPQAQRLLGPRARFYAGFLVSKPAGEPARHWHQDWWAWDEEVSRSEAPPQVALMYYLQDTTVGNGCLRVIPGTHRRGQALHDLYALTPSTHAHPREQAVEVQAGDVVVLDARLLHGCYANLSAAARDCLTLWYSPEFAALPEPLQAYLGQIHTEATQAALGGLAARYEGRAHPYPQPSYVPGRAFRLPEGF